MSGKYAEIRAALGAATPGPWTQGHSTEGSDCVWLAGNQEPERGMGVADMWIDCNTPANARYIAACHPETIRALLAERDALQGENKRLRKLVSELADNDTYETEYDGRMYSICHGCGAQDGEEHRRPDCLYVRARAALSQEPT